MIVITRTASEPRLGRLGTVKASLLASLLDVDNNDFEAVQTALKCFNHVWMVYNRQVVSS